MAKSNGHDDDQAAVGDMGDRVVAVMAARRGKLLPGAAPPERDVGDAAAAIMAKGRGKRLPGVAVRDDDHAARVHVGDVGDAAAAIMAAGRGKTLVGSKRLVWIDASDGKRLLVSPELKKAMETGPLPGESQTDFAVRMTAYFPQKRTNVRTSQVGNA